MCGSTRSTTSPSSSSTSRNTPCAAGCCGPKFRVKLRSSGLAAAVIVVSVNANPYSSGYSLFIGFAVACLLVARQRVGWTFPRRQEVEVTEFLREPDRLVDHAFLLVVVPQLDETGEGKILAQRMALETVVG